MRRRRLLLAAPVALSGCTLFRHRRPAPPPPLHYVIGAPYEAGGIWRYPRESFDAEETGLAIALTPHEKFLTDGAPYDPTALLAAHPTLQLPSVARVTNLETGLSLLVRIDARGPAARGRALALSPRAMTLLGPGSEPGILRVRVQVAEAESRTLADLVAADRDRIAVSAAPTATVRAETLPPLGGASRPGVAAAPPPAAATVAAPAAPSRLPEQLVQYPVRSTGLFIALGAFSGPRYARALAARLADLGASADTDYAAPRDRAWRVRIGPIASAAQADAVLDRTLAAGVVDVRIVVDEE